MALNSEDIRFQCLEMAVSNRNKEESWHQIVSNALYLEHYITSGEQKVRDLGSDKPLFCWFCGKSQHEVPKLIAGPEANICIECVRMCAEIDAEPATTAEVKP